MWHDQGKWVTCSKISISFFLHHFLVTSKCFNLMQTPLQLDIWLQSYEGFVNAKNNIKQRNLNTVFANISKTIFPTSDSFLLIMSQMLKDTASLSIFLLPQDCSTSWCLFRNWTTRNSITPGYLEYFQMVYIIKHTVISK